MDLWIIDEVPLTLGVRHNTVMLVSGSSHNKIVYQVVILSVLNVESEAVGGVWVVEQLRRCDRIA